MHNFLEGKLMCKLKLDINQAHKLRAVITANPYAFMYEVDRYYSLCTIMDRMEDTVDVLNKLDLQTSYDTSLATGFIAWINYAYSLIGCIKELNKIFVKSNNTTLFYDKNTKYVDGVKEKECAILGCYYQSFTSDGTDDLYFSFLRSIVLAHAIKSDAKEFDCFRKGKYLYTPLVRWNQNGKIDITYYSPIDNTSNLNTEKIEIEINDLFSYILSRYGYLDTIFDYIKKSKLSDKKARANSYRYFFKCIPNDVMGKLKLLKEAYKENGTIDEKNGAGNTVWILKYCEDIMGFNYSQGNESAIAEFEGVVNAALDDLIEKLKKQELESALIYKLFDFYSYNRDDIFSNCAYEISKLISEYDFIWSSNYFGEIYDKVRAAVSNYVNLMEDMSDQEKTYLSIIAYCLHNNR